MNQKTIEIEVDDFSCQPRQAHDNTTSLGRAKLRRDEIADDLLSLAQAQRELQRRIDELNDRKRMLDGIISAEDPE